MLVWGTSARHYPQHCGLSQVLNDEDVVQIVKKKVKYLILFYFFQKKRKEEYVKDVVREKPHGCSFIIIS